MTASSAPAANLRLRFRTRVLGPTIRVSVIMAVVFELAHWIAGERLPVDEWAVMQTGCLFTAAMTFGVLSALCPVGIMPQGIRSPDWRYLARVHPWDQIDTVHVVNLLGIRFLAMYQQNCDFGTWVPLFLRDEAGFWRTVEACVGPDHPLRMIERRR